MINMDGGNTGGPKGKQCKAQRHWIKQTLKKEPLIVVN